MDNVITYLLPNHMQVNGPYICSSAGVEQLLVDEKGEYCINFKKIYRTLPLFKKPTQNGLVFLRGIPLRKTFGRPSEDLRKTSLTRP